LIVDTESFFFEDFFCIQLVNTIIMSSSARLSIIPTGWWSEGKSSDALDLYAASQFGMAEDQGGAAGPCATDLRLQQGCA